ncbi:protein MICROTUBULE BINDING PROTEIN 2C-like isoform X2 [Zingiber officinale]|uniref:protein MICROTUBULE BINDING PROTEIN 2C-like isoform X2 n=1 Tax=Zingiber officinale TaxID=94328 RepID=UPI001C4A79EE|nr:protein MICROTUBULE BINDING PROTEIN 2C-like isoform X2 [Zingiber officinale]
MSMIERQCRLRRSTDRTLEAKPSVSEGRHRIPSPPLPAEAADGGNVDRVLFKNLVEMVPLVESLMEGALVLHAEGFCDLHTGTIPPEEGEEDLLYLKTTEAKGARETPTFSAKKQRDLDNTQRNKQSDSCNGFTIETEKILRAQEELNVLREQINDLQRKILEKDEALKSAESEINQMKAAYISIDELRIQIAEKDSMVKSINSQLSNAKNSLADKQATLERLTWEAQMSNKKIEELQGERVSMDYEITKLMQIFEELFANHSSIHPDASLYSYSLEPLPVLSDMDDIASEKLEETRAAYVAAVAAAKENPTEELLARAAEARLHLQALVI